MEFLRVVEEELRGLAAEARRRHPVVQEAAERAILKLRNMREEYAVALRRQHEGQAPPLSMFRSQDLLRPFLLACNHSDASPRLMIMAMGSMQYLINRDAILPSDAPNILRVLAIQSQSKEADVQKRVLQTMVMVVTWKSCEMKEDTIAQALSVCLGLHDAKNAMVRTAADMTVRQIISLLFDRVADELGVTKFGAESVENNGVVVNGEGEGVSASGRIEVEDGVDGKGDGLGNAEGALRCAHLVFQDLCVLSRGEQGQWIKRTSVSTTLGLELVEQILSQQPVLFRRFGVMRGLLSKEVCPLVLQTLRRRMSFPLLVRVVRCAATLSVAYGDLLPSEAQAILSTMLASLGSGIGTGTDEEREGQGTIDFSAVDDGNGGCLVSWPAMLTLEAVHRILSSPALTLELFRLGRQDSVATTVVEEMVHGVSQYLVRNLSSQHSVQAFESMAQSIRLGRTGSGSSTQEGRRLPLPAALVNALARGTTSAMPSGGTPRSGNSQSQANGGSTRSSPSEFLHETEEPSLDEAEPLLWALQCVVDFAASVASLVDEEFGTSDTNMVVPSSIAVKPDEPLPKGSRRESLRSVCLALWSPVLSCLSHVLVHCSDPLIVATAADGYKAFAFAGGILGLNTVVDGFMGSLCRFSLPQWHGADVVVGGGVAGGGGGGGGSSQTGGSPALGWTHVGALQSLLQVAHRLGNLLRGSWHVVLDTLEQAATLLTRRAIARPRWSPNALAEAELEAVEQHCLEVFEAGERLVRFSTCLEDEALYTLMSSLQALAVVDLANSATILPQERSARESQQVAGQGGQGVGPGAAAVAAASGIAAMVGAAARAAMSGPEGRESRDARNTNAGAGGKVSRGPADGKARNPWVSSTLVVQCAVANTSRLAVIWELVSGHLRVVAKAREPATREYAIRALSELIVDGVQRLHGVHSNPESPPAPAVHPQAPVSASNTPTSKRDIPTKSSGGPPTSQGGGRGGSTRGGFMPSLNRGRSEEGEDEEGEQGLRWMFDGDVSGVFVAAGRGTTGTSGGMASRGGFEGVLFETMGLFALTPHVDTREAMLQTLYTILQSCGQVLDSAWAVILNLLHSVAKAATDAPPPVSPSASMSSAPVRTREEGSEVEVEDERTSGAWGGGCLPLAFKCLHLIVDDFLERVPREEIPKLVTCTGAFGRQTENVNLSLTAIGMLWSVCDSFADEGVKPQGTSSSSSLSSSSASHAQEHPFLHSMWPAMLFELRSISIDFRPELRNCAVNTLFSAAVGNGASLTEEEWKQFLLEVTFPLMAKVLASTNSASRGANTAVAPELKKGVRMLMHHTRDTDRKQWNETRVLAMQGLGRVLRAYVGDLARHDWFCGEGGVWAQSLEVYRDACLLGSDSQEVALAGVDGMSTMVLLVGKMGLKSLQVRAGAGMRIVDGTLQMSPSRRKAASASGGQRGGSGAGGKGRGEGVVSTPEFNRARPALFGLAWVSMMEASRFAVDENGDVASAFVLGLAAVYKAGIEEGAEFCPGQDGAEQRTRELFQMLESLILPRVAPVDPNTATSRDPQRRPVYVPRVAPGQRAILDFLQEDLRSGWQLALHLLLRCSVAGATGDGHGAAGRAGEGDGASGSAVGITVECASEAASVLSGMMSERVPRRDRALALESLLDEVSAPCVRRVQDALHRHPAETLTSADGTTTPSPAGSPSLSLDSYVAVMRLLLSLLSDGLPCLSDANHAATTPSSQTSTEESVSAFGGAIKAVAAVAECYRLGQVAMGPSAPAGQEGGGRDTAEEGNDGGEIEVFSRLLCEALSLVTAAVCRDVVPRVQRGVGGTGSEDVVRDLIDTLGKLAKPSSDVGTVSSRGCSDGLSASFRLAVGELCGMCGGEKTQAGDWAQLGLPLRRRACWQLLQCVWTTARHFRELEDADTKDGGLDDSVRAAADRCSCVLAALGKLRMAPGLLTVNFRKLVADKQAQEKSMLKHPPFPNPNRNSSQPPTIGENGDSTEAHNTVWAREDVEWAALAEDDGRRGVASGQERHADEGVIEVQGGEQGHLMVVVRALLMCTASRSSLRVRQAAAELLGEADIPRAVDMLQDEVAALKQELRQRDLLVKKKEREIGTLRAQVAAGAFM